MSDTGTGTVKLDFSVLPALPTSKNLLVLAAELERNRAILDARLIRATPWHGRLRREATGHARPNEAQRYANAHAEALTHALAGDPVLSTSCLRRFHDIVVGGTEFRKSVLRVGRHGEHAFPSADKVPFLLKELFEAIASSGELTCVSAARLHLGILSIHPFDDGNGRTARIMATMCMIRAGYRSNLLTGVEGHFNFRPDAYIAYLDLYRFGFASESECVANLLQSTILSSMYASWYRRRSELAAEILRQAAASIPDAMALTDKYVCGAFADGDPPEICELLQANGITPIQHLLSAATRELRHEFLKQIQAMRQENDWSAPSFQGAACVNKSVAWIEDRFAPPRRSAPSDFIEDPGQNHRRFSSRNVNQLLRTTGELLLAAAAMQTPQVASYRRTRSPYRRVHPRSNDSTTIPNSGGWPPYWNTAAIDTPINSGDERVYYGHGIDPHSGYWQGPPTLDLSQATTDVSVWVSLSAYRSMWDTDIAFYDRSIVSPPTTTTR